MAHSQHGDSRLVEFEVNGVRESFDAGSANPAMSFRKPRRTGTNRSECKIKVFEESNAEAFDTAFISPRRIDQLGFRLRSDD